MANSHRCLYLIALCCIGAGGCATTNGRLARAHLEVPLKVVVLQSPMTIDPGRLQKVFASGSKRELSASEEPLAQGIKEAQAHALAAMKSTLTKQSGLTVVTPPSEEKQLADEIQGRDFRDFGAVLPQEEADRLRTTTGAEALLRFRITDYGYTPKSWRMGYIVFEVTTTLALAAVIAYSGSAVAKGAAGAYLAQEAVEETAEGYAGFHALDVVCRPVRIEAELIRLHPVMTVWNAHDTGLSDVKLSRLTRKVGPSERDGQLDQATDYAVADVASKLSRAVESIRP